MKNLTMRLAVLLLSTLGLLTGAFAQLTPSQDSYTFSNHGGQNYGTAQAIVVEYSVIAHPPAIANSYIQFDLSSIPSSYTGANVTKASLKLFVNGLSGAGGSFNVDLVNGSWTELGIRYNNAPALGTTIASSIPLTTANVNDYVIVDVTSAVQAWLDGTQSNDGIALVGNSGLGVLFDSKENTATSHPPELDIVFASGGGTITGVTTASGSGLTGGGDTGNLNLSLESCPLGQVLASNGPGGGWTCSTVSGGGGGITGSGTANSLPLFATATSVASSNVFQNGLNIGIGTKTPQALLDVNGSVNALNGFNIGETPFAFGSSASGNAFLGFAGNATTTGSQNTAVGQNALASDSTGYSNTAVGYALSGNTTGNFNVGVGSNTLLNTTTGAFYTAVGSFAGHVLDHTPGTGGDDTALGSGAAFGTGTLTNATAVGSNAEVTESNALVLGAISGLNGGTSVNVGIGTTAPLYTLDVNGVIRSSAGGFMFPDGSVQTTKATGGGGGIASVTGTNGVSATTSNGNVTVSNTGLISITNGFGIASLGGQNPIVQIDPTAVPLLNGGNTFNGSQVVNGSFGAITSSGATGAPAVQGIAGAISGGSNGGYFLTGDPSGTGVVGVNTANSGNAYAGFFQGNVAVTGATGTGSLSVGGDLPMTHSPRMTFSGTVANFTTSQFQPAGYFVPDKPILITRLTTATGNLDTIGANGCGTFSQMGFIAGADPVFLITTGNKSFNDSGPINPPVPVAAGIGIQVVGLEASGGATLCQSGGNMTATVEYAMQ